MITLFDIANALAKVDAAVTLRSATQSILLGLAATQRDGMVIRENSPCQQGVVHCTISAAKLRTALAFGPE